MKSLITYFANVRAELKHVVWPTTKQATTHTLLVVALSVIAALFIALADYVFTSGVGAILGR